MKTYLQFFVLTISVISNIRKKFLALRVMKLTEITSFTISGRELTSALVTFKSTHLKRFFFLVFLWMYYTAEDLELAVGQN